jgi:hypothetical protein
MTTQQSFTQSWRWRYGFLALLLVLFVWNLMEFPERLHSQAPDRFSGMIITLMLIFNHIAFWCIPPGRLRAVFRAFAYAWVVFGCAYVFTKGFSGFLFR